MNLNSQFRQLQPAALSSLTQSIDAQTYATAKEIVDEVRTSGEVAVRKYAEQFDALSSESSLVANKDEIQASLAHVNSETQELLQRTRERIETFARAQRNSIHDLDLKTPEGRAGHRWIPLRVAGCYAPGGRYALPSSVLMTAVTARVAGVEEVVVASPKSDQVTLAAAAIAGADKVLRVGGAQAIAALTFGIPNQFSPCDTIVGPGNRFVTAAKAIVSRFTRIDMLAGPSELVVATAGDADPGFVAADLLAQAEHDPDARPILITTDVDFPAAVQVEIEKRLATLPTADIARQAITSGGYLIAKNIEEALQLCEKIAPEHLSIQGTQFQSVADRFVMGAALFIGSKTAEVFGDYGAGPNHTLPTGGLARSQSALSVLDFMRFQTFLELENESPDLISDAAAMGRLEGLEAHARSAEVRNPIG